MLYKGPENTNSPALLLAAVPTSQGIIGGLSSLALFLCPSFSKVLWSKSHKNMSKIETKLWR